MIRILIGVACSIAALQAAYAQQAGAQAEALFREGRQLMAAGKTAEACSAFAASEKLDPSVSTLLNLAACRAKNGQLATAWGLFLQAEHQTRDATSNANKEFHRIATDRASRLEARVSKLTIDVPAGSRLASLQVRRDATPVDQGMWNRALPIDGGTYTITAQAPGATTWTMRVTIANEGDSKTVVVPLLRARAPEPTRAPTPGGTRGPGPGPRPLPRVPAGPGWAPKASLFGYISAGVITVLTIGVVAENADISTADTARAIGGLAVLYTAVAIPVTASGGGSARRDPRVEGAPTLRIVSWVGYGLTLVDAVALIAISYDTPVDDGQVASVGLLGALSAVGFAYDAGLSASEATALQARPAGVQAGLGFARTPDHETVPLLTLSGRF